MNEFKFQETISKLYLRLNGYFLTGFIIHSSENQIKSEIDLIGLRFPGHNQDDTEHNTSSFLELNEGIDVIIGEVKSRGQRFQFNNTLRGEKSMENWIKILKWIGLFEKDQIEPIATSLIQLVQPNRDGRFSESLKTLGPIVSNHGRVNIRPIIFSPNTTSIQPNQDKFINWTEINSYLWECLCPSEIRHECGVRYDFTAWGSEFQSIIQAYKSRHKTGQQFDSFDELYSLLNTNN